MGFHHLRPGAKLVLHAEQFGLREFILQRIHHFRVVYPIVVFGNDGLRLRTVEPVQVGLRRLFRAVGFDVFIHPGHRELRQNVGFRDHHFKSLRLILLANIVHFRLETDQHIAQAALGEGSGRPASAGVEDFDVLQELGHKLFGFGFIATVGFIRRAPGRQVGVPRVARGFRVREDQLNVRADQVVPVMNVFLVAFAHQEAHRRIERRAVVWQAALPVGRDQVAFVMQDLHVRHLVVGHHVRLQALQDRQRLLGRAGVRLLDGQLVSTIVLRPLLLKRRVKGGKQLAGDIIGAVQQLRRLRLRHQQHGSRQRQISFFQ